MQYSALLVGCALFFALFLTSNRSQAQDWMINAGPVVRLGMDVKVNGGSYVQEMGLHAAKPGRYLPNVPQVTLPYRYQPQDDDISQYGDRSFDDGFVYMDSGTADPDTIEPGLTWYWGYDHENQYNQANNTLTFQREYSGEDIQHLSVEDYGEATYLETLRNDAVSLNDKVNGAGLQLSIGRNLVSRKVFSIGFFGGIKAIWGADTSFHTSTYREKIQKDRIKVEGNFTFIDIHDYRDTYTYDTTGIEPPSAPYEGTYEGPGTVIPNTPSSLDHEVVQSDRQTEHNHSTHVVESTSWTAANQIHFDIDANICDLWLGPAFRFRANNKVSFSLTPAITLNLVDMDVSRSEAFIASYSDGSTQTLNSWKDSDSEDKILFGVSCTAGVDLNLFSGWFAGAFGGYDWVSDDADISIGPNTVSMDTSGFSLGMEVGKQF